MIRCTTLSLAILLVVGSATSSSIVAGEKKDPPNPVVGKVVKLEAIQDFFGFNIRYKEGETAFQIAPTAQNEAMIKTVFFAAQMGWQLRVTWKQVGTGFTASQVDAFP